MGLWHDIKVRLGLESDWDEEYDDDYHDPDEDETGAGDGFYGRSVGGSGSGRSDRDFDTDRGGRSAERDYLRPVSGSASTSSAPAAAAGPTPQVKMHIVEPKSFSEAQSIADKFKKGTPVIMNMTMTQPDVAKRMIDFASGLTYGLDGGLQKISDRVFMLTPANVDVSAGDFRRLKENGLFNPE